MKIRGRNASGCGNKININIQKKNNKQLFDWQTICVCYCQLLLVSYQERYVHTTLTCMFYVRTSKRSLEKKKVRGS